MTRKQPKYRKQVTRYGKAMAFVELSDRRIYLGDYGTPESKAKYRRELAEWKGRGHTPRVSAVEITIAEVLAQFWKHAEEYYRKPDGTPTDTIHSYRMALHPLIDLYEDTAATQFGPKRLKMVREQMIALGWCRSSVNKAVQQITRVFKWAAGEEMIPVSVPVALSTVDGLKAGRTKAPDRPPVMPVPLEYVYAIEPHVSRQIWALIQLQLLTAARGGELVAMRPVDLDTSGRVWVYTVKSHKTDHFGHERTIYLGPKAQQAVEPFINRAVTSYMFSPKEAESERRAKDAAVRRRPNWAKSPTKTARKIGDCYSSDSYRRAIERACRAARVPIWRPHQLRHTAATRIRRERGIEQARIILGHLSGDMTELYTERDQSVAINYMSECG